MEYAIIILKNGGLTRGEFMKDRIDEYLSRGTWKINANANLGFSNAGLVAFVSGEAIKEWWLESVFNKEKEYHKRGDLYIHDLDCLTGYCTGWSLRRLLKEGFGGCEGAVESSPPKKFKTALGQMANFLGVLQSEWAGAQAFSSFDTFLAPYVFAENLTLDDVVKEVEAFVYNLNTPSRWGQTPFTNITLDFTVPNDLRDVQPMSGNQLLIATLKNKEDILRRMKERSADIVDITDITYKHFAPEMDLIITAFYRVLNEGDKNGRPFTFPIPTVNITEDFVWTTAGAEEMLRNTTKFGNSYFQNFLGSQYITDEKGNKVRNPNASRPEDIRSMCCRLKIDLLELKKRGNGLFGSAELTGSLGVVTINMARLGYKYKKHSGTLKKKILELVDVAVEILQKRRAFIQSQYDKNLYPFTKRYLHTLSNHFSTVGVNGMNEMLLNFSDCEYNIASKTGEALAFELLTAIRERLEEHQKKTNVLFNLEATPAEGCTYYFATKDAELFKGQSHIQGTAPHIFYTNSSQLPVDFTDNPFEALKKQNRLQQVYTGGTVLHLYMAERSTSKITKDLVLRALSNYQVPYITITPTFSVCPVHGYLKGEQEKCPTCGVETEIWTRVMGYHRPKSKYNLGKKGEHDKRELFQWQ